MIIPLRKIICLHNLRTVLRPLLGLLHELGDLGVTWAKTDLVFIGLSIVSLG